MNSVVMRMKLRLSMTASLSCGCELVILRPGRGGFAVALEFGLRHRGRELGTCGSVRGGFAIPLVARRRKQRVDDGNENRAGGERPENAVRAEEPVVDVPGAERDERGEEDPSRARIGRGLRIGNHEEGEEQQRAALQPVKRNRERLADPESASDDQCAQEDDEGVRDVAARRAIDYQSADAGDQESEEGYVSPLSR